MLLWATLAQAGLVAQWRFDAGTGTSAVDASGNGNTCTLYESDTAGSQGPAWTTGRLYGALSFDGSNDNTRCGDINAIEGGASVTLAAWINATSIGNSRYVVSKSDDTVALSTFHLGFGSSSPALSCYMYGSGSSEKVGTTSLQTGVWYHVACTYNGTQVCLYLNGILEGTCLSKTGNLGNGTKALTVGVWSLIPTSRLWHGLIDEVRLYNHAFSAAEVQRLYIRGRAAR